MLHKTHKNHTINANKIHTYHWLDVEFDLEKRLISKFQLMHRVRKIDIHLGVY